MNLNGNIARELARTLTGDKEATAVVYGPQDLVRDMGVEGCENEEEVEKWMENVRVKIEEKVREHFTAENVQLENLPPSPHP